ncbi:MAG: hypothetical protein EXR18_01565 [Flavobacteriaceae bacterium]|nr:hypothetical protein [Flavobacteriaceae bacterium]
MNSKPLNYSTRFHLKIGMISAIIIIKTSVVFSQVILNANGPGNTYERITSIFAPGNGVSALEAPDLYHPWKWESA